jgi:YidC/Oxa1 family membrane protein insertase
LTTIDEIADRRTRFGENEMKGLPSLRDSYWQSAVVDTPQGQAVEFRYVVGPEHLEAFGVSGSLEFVKRYRLDRVPAEQQDNDAYRAYHLVMEIEILNHGPEPVKVAYRQDGPTGLPLEGWWYSYKTFRVRFSRHRP